MINIISKNKSDTLVIFVHGFTGNEDTWTNSQGISFADMLMNNEELRGKLDFANFDYTSKFFNTSKVKVIGNLLKKVIFNNRKKDKKVLDIISISNHMKSCIRFYCKDYKNIILIAHSMGGLISKSFILDELKSNNETKVRLFISLAVPHDGSNLAYIGKQLWKNNNQISDLSPLSEIIKELNSKWIKQQLKPKTVYFYGQNDEIVPYTSSVSYDIDETDVVHCDDDHTSISKPESCEEIVFIGVKDTLDNFIKENDKIEKESKKHVEYSEITLVRDEPIISIDNNECNDSGIVEENVCDSNCRENIESKIYSEDIPNTVYKLDELMVKIDEYRECKDNSEQGLSYILNSIVLKKYSDDLIRMKEIIKQEKFKFVFIGNTKIGKTTTICYLFDLFIKTNNTYSELLKVQGGNCTPCNTIIRNSDKTRIEIEPMLKNDVERFLRKYCNEIIDENSEFESEFGNLSEEIKGIFKIMLESTGLDEDQLRLAYKNDRQALYNKIAKSIKMHEYNDDNIVLTYDNNENKGIGELEWLQDKILKYSSGLGERYIVPNLMTIEIDRKIKKLPEYIEEIIDTRGLYEIEIEDNDSESFRENRNSSKNLPYELIRDDLKNYIEDKKNIIFFVNQQQDTPKYLLKHFNSMIHSKYAEDILRNYVIINLNKNEINKELDNYSKLNGINKDKSREKELKIINKKVDNCKHRIKISCKKYIEKLKKEEINYATIENWEALNKIISNNNCEYINCVPLDSLKFLRNNEMSQLELINYKDEIICTDKDIEKYRMETLSSIVDSLEKRKLLVVEEVKQIYEQVYRVLNDGIMMKNCEVLYREFVSFMKGITYIYNDKISKDVIMSIESSENQHGNHWKMIIKYILWHKGYNDIYADEIISYAKHILNSELQEYKGKARDEIKQLATKINKQNDIDTEGERAIVRQLNNFIDIICEQFSDEFTKELYNSSSALYGELNKECVLFWESIKDKYESRSNKESIKNIVKGELQKQRNEYEFLDDETIIKFNEFITSKIKTLFRSKLLEKLERELYVSK